MKKVAMYTLCLFVLVGTGLARKKDKEKTAEDVYEYVEQMGEYTEESSALLKEEMKSLTRKERKRLMKMVMDDVDEVKANRLAADNNMVALYVLAVLLPPVSVGLYTDWKTPTLWNLLFTLLFWLPGIIHAFIVLTR